MEKIKHNHCLTDILKVCLFSLLMLAPLLASVSQMLYVTLNKNAKESYYGETINQEQILTPSNIDNNTNYLLYWSNVDMYNQSPSPRIYILNFDILNRGSMNDTTYNNVLSNKDNIDYIQFSTYNNALNLQLIGINMTTINITSIDWVFTFNITSISDNVTISNLRYIEYNEYSYLDNAFYYGVNQMTQSDLFNWTQNTGIYTGVHAMTNGIGIESVFIPMLLTYWLVLTIVYIIIDVVIETFKYLTHMLQNKVKSKTS